MNLGQVRSIPEPLFFEAERAEDNGDLEEANQLLLETAQLGHTGAQVAVANNYSSGRGLPRSLKKAAYWYKRAYGAGYESGALNLPVDKLKGGNARAAIFWFKRAVELQSGEAALELAKLFALRRGGIQKELELLGLTQRLRPSEISEQAKEDAAELLSLLTGKSH